MANIKPDPEIASPILIQRFINRLEDWTEQIRQAGIKNRLGEKDAVPADHHLVRDLELLGIKANLADVAELTELAKHLQTWLESAPVVHLTFSTPPSQRAKRAIVQWLQDAIDHSLLADFKVNGSIAAGFMLRTKNHLYDFTANEVLWKNRNWIGEMVKNAG